jgi:hypothetical protein
VGTAQAVSGGVAQRQAAGAQERAQAAAYREQQQSPAAPGAATNELIDQLAKLGELHRAGVLTDAEFAAQKAKLLG